VQFRVPAWVLEFLVAALLGLAADLLAELLERLLVQLERRLVQLEWVLALVPQAEG
jgi:hypothetical protein